ncbi:DUF3152 domain-containing protein [Halostreptopolyspora alba]|uniref:DUF3152 domain-containing protein n=1 Tax=Halostreptopolyspora alba TaxID=2487137 RepID=A0A3N0EAE7_9ACTN|nr:DUF3152 domain-containing protein [Nocardiopsaceae bacterium YIM 96095]
MPSADPRRGRTHRRPKHRRRRHPRFPILLGCIIVLVELVLVTTLPPPGDDGGGTRARDNNGAELSAPEPTSEPKGEAAEEDPPVLRRSVVEEVDNGSGEMEVVDGESEASGEGSPTRYLVEVERDLPGDATDFADAVEIILGDERSWTSEGEGPFARVDSPEEADFRVTLAAPDTVDELCAPLRTNGEVSCSTGNRAIINQNRWVSGVDHFGDELETYRTYVVNHEVGHVLGRGHVECAEPGEPAPIMQQQTFGLDGCEPNGWVNP